MHRAALGQPGMARVYSLSNEEKIMERRKFLTKAAVGTGLGASLLAGAEQRVAILDDRDAGGSSVGDG